MLGVLLYTFADREGIARPEQSDKLFALIATGGYLPYFVGVLFIIGLISSAYAAAGSALTALTTSFTVDVMGINDKTENQVSKLRKNVHIGMALVMGLVIFIFEALNNTSVIDAVYILASYTYGPILGLFAFGIISKKRLYDKWVPVVAILAPVLCYFIQKITFTLWDYQFSYALIVVNGAITYLGMWILSIIHNDKK